MAYDGEVKDYEINTLAPRVREILERSRAKIARGWCQGHNLEQVGWFRPNRYCIAGAIRDVAGGGAQGYSAAHEARRALIAAMKTFPGAAMPLEFWNDQGGRTQAEVVALFDKALET